MNQAKSDSWKTQPMPEQTSVLDYTADFTSEEYIQISNGYIPQDMDDRWFIYMDDNVLNFHRSWTGHCIYIVDFSYNGEKYSVRSAAVNRQPEQYKQTNDECDSWSLHYLISNLLLGRREPFPVPSSLPKDTPKGVFQHSAVGTGNPEVRVGRKPWWKPWK